MKEKAIFLLVGLVSCVFISLIFFPIHSLAQQKPIVIKFSHHLPEAQPVAKQARVFEKCVKEKSKGNVVIEVYPTAQLFGHRDVLPAVRKGAVEMAAVVTPTIQGLIPLMEIWDIPFLFHSYEQVERAWYGYPGDILKHELERTGLKLMCPGYYGFTEVCNSKHEIRRPEDLKGLILRPPGPMIADVVRAMGGAAVVMGGEEAYLAMARKVVDGCVTGLNSMVSRKFWEVQKYLTLIHLGYVDIPMVINLQFWKSLPGEVQNLLQECAKESEQFVLKESIKDENEGARILSEKGMKVYTLTPAEIEEFRKASAPVTEAWIKKHGDVAAKMVKFVENIK